MSEAQKDDALYRMMLTECYDRAVRAVGDDDRISRSLERTSFTHHCLRRFGH